MITLPSQITRIGTMADGSWRIQVDLGELKPEVVQELAKTLNKALVIAVTGVKGFSKEEKAVLNELDKIEADGSGKEQSRQTENTTIRPSRWLG
jgi:aspartokinase-like uncharacterized kinase